jgi:cysteine-rich repeat protein
MMRRAVLVTPLLASCLAAETVECPIGGLCPPGTECREDRGAQVCVPESCGNGAVEPGEDCDDGNTTSGDGCQATCRLTNRPSPRFGVAMAYDSVRNTLVVFGGESTVTFDETWIWDGTSWMKRTLSTQTPAARWGAAMTYDSTRGRVLMFGGYSAIGQPLGDFWEWDDTGWYRITPTSSVFPPARGRASMTYDRARRVAVLFGGQDENGTLLDATWEWDGERWFQRASSAAPSPRQGAAMTFDSSRAESILIGGANDGNTWLWNGARWATLGGALAPTEFRNAGLAFDVERQRAVLFGGAEQPDLTTLGGTLELTSSGWEEHETTPAPPRRELCGMAYAASHDAILMFGGLGLESVRYNDLWSWDGVTWREWP